MKQHQSLLMIIMFLVIVLPGCKEKTEPLSDSEVDAIKNEINNAFELSADAASKHDVEAIMKFFLKDEDLVYAGNGVLIKGWSNFCQVVNSVHSDPRNQGFRLEFEDTYVKVIGPDCALVTGKGKFIDFPTEEGPVNKNLTMSFLFEKIDGKWLVTAGHESTPENIF
jgi:uncharacterized protein (TIGR02246 family)